MQAITPPAFMILLQNICAWSNSLFLIYYFSTDTYWWGQLV